MGGGMWPLVLLCLMSLTPTQSPQSLFHGVRGRVTDTTRQGIPDAFVVIHNLETGEQQEANVQQDGRFAFECLRDGEYRLTVSSAGFLSSTIERLHYSYPKDMNLSVLMNFEPRDHDYIWPGYLLVVETVDASAQAPLGETKVDVTGDTADKSLSGFTDKCGKRWWYLKPGKYTLTATKAGFQKETLSLEVGNDRSIKVPLHKARPG